jgi:hypothetical protein
MNIKETFYTYLHISHYQSIEEQKSEGKLNDLFEIAPTLIEKEKLPLDNTHAQVTLQSHTNLCITHTQPLHPFHPHIPLQTSHNTLSRR